MILAWHFRLDGKIKLNFATFDVAAIYELTWLCETAYNLSLMLSLINV